MKKTFYIAAAALLMASTAAHAGSGISFQIDGQKIHIDAPRNCNSLSCISITNNGSAVNLKNFNLKGKKADDDDVASNAPPSAPAPAAPPPPVAQAPAPPPAPAPATVYAPPAPVAPVANAAPSAPDASRERISGLPSNTVTRTAPPAPPAPPAPAASTAPAAPAPAASNAPPAAQTAAESAPPAAAPNTPLGLWQTADNKGNVRIEQCGPNLCGFAEHTNDRILINMKPVSDNKWTGRIHDPDSGSNYDSNIAMKSPNLLKVQGCAFGGLFCGGQTWKRIS